MPIDLVLDSLDSVEESEKAFFDEVEGGKFKYNWSKRDTAIKKPVDDKNKQFKTEKTKLKEEFDSYKKRFEGLEDDEELTRFREWKEKQAEGGDDPGKGKDDAAEVTAQLKNRHKDELTKLKTAAESEKTALQQKYDGLANELKGERLTNALSALAAESGVYKDRIGKFVKFMLFEGLFDWQPGEDGKPGKLVFMEDGEPSDTDPKVAFKDKLPELYGEFFETDETGGSGSETSRKASVKPRWKRSTMTDTEKAQFLETHSQAEYDKLPWK